MMRHCTRFLILALACSSIAGLQAHSTEIPGAQRQAIEEIIHDYLMKNPEVLLEALHNAREKLHRDAEAKAEKALNDRHSEIFDDPATPVGGNAEGDVTIVEFFDYRCPYCKQVQPSLKTLLKEDHRLRFVYKEMPVLGAASVAAAHAALAAQRQGKYEAFHTAMMAAKGQITEDTVFKVAASVELDIDQLKHDMTAPDIEEAIRKNLALAEALNITGTPGFIIGGKIVTGALDPESLRKRIADARKG